MLKGFREFIVRGNVIDLAVAVIIGAAFTKVVNSLVDDIIMPPIGLLLGNVDFTNLFVVLKQGAKAAGPYATIGDAKAAGAVTLNYGLFISTLVTFLIVGFVVYLMVRSITRLGPKKAEAVSQVQKLIAAALSQYGFIVKQFTINELRAPEAVIQAINQKNVMQQQALTAQNLTLNDASASTVADLYPGGSGAVKLSVTNPNPFAVTITGVTGAGTITSDKGAACDASTGVTFTNTTGLSQAVGAGATVTFSLAGKVAMSNASDNSCQGAIFSVPITLAATS